MHNNLSKTIKESTLFEENILVSHKKKSSDKRCSEMFLRNQFQCVGNYDFPIIKKQQIELNFIRLIACTNTIKNEREFHNYGVHFFVDDFNFESIYKEPYKTLNKYSQYRFCCSPDFSIYGDMPKWRQIESVAYNRWCGAWWQSKGIKVIPTISWDKYPSFDFCFDGVEVGSVVAIATYACYNSKFDFLKGYDAMIERIKPEAIICYGKPFQGMHGNIIPIPVTNPRQFHRNKELNI